jgi:hypothetical protein
MLLGRAESGIKLTRTRIRTGKGDDSEYCVAHDDNDEEDFLEVNESPKKKQARELRM